MSKILGPIITEKSMNDASKGRYTFKVNVIKVATINIKGRSLRAGTRRVEIALSSFKKAIAQLKEGQKISIFDIGGKE